MILTSRGIGRVLRPSSDSLRLHSTRGARLAQPNPLIKQSNFSLTGLAEDFSPIDYLADRWYRLQQPLFLSLPAWCASLPSSRRLGDTENNVFDHNKDCQPYRGSVLRRRHHLDTRWSLNGGGEPSDCATE